eukprot:2609928-Prymnesium_polylepis.1
METDRARPRHPVRSQLDARAAEAAQAGGGLHPDLARPHHPPLELVRLRHAGGPLAGNRNRPAAAAAAAAAPRRRAHALSAREFPPRDPPPHTARAHYSRSTPP